MNGFRASVPVAFGAPAAGKSAGNAAGALAVAVGAPLVTLEGDGAGSLHAETTSTITTHWVARFTTRMLSSVETLVDTRYHVLMKLFLCVGCNRHVKGDGACPFCGADPRGALVGDSMVRSPRTSRARAVVGVAAGAAVALAISGCSSEPMYGCVCPPYGQPPPVDASTDVLADGGAPDATDASATEDADAADDAPHE